MHRVEDKDLDPRLAQGIDRLAGKTLDVAEIVENNLDLDPRARLGAEDPLELIPELALGKDKVFQKDKTLGFAGTVDDIAQQRRTLGKIGHLRVLIQAKTAAAQKICRARPRGQLTRQLVERDLAAGAHTLRLIRDTALLLGQMALLRRAAPQEPEDEPHRGSQQKQDEPDELIRKLTRLIVDMDRKKDRNDLQDPVADGHILLQHMRDQDDGGDLRRQKQDHEHDPQRR